MKSLEKKSGYFVYILLCENGAYYTGYTTNLERRYQEHLAGTAKCKFTRSFKPLKIAQSWKFDTKNAAMKAEIFIKKLHKQQKQKIIFASLAQLSALMREIIM